MGCMQRWLVYLLLTLQLHNELEGSLIKKKHFNKIVTKSSSAGDFLLHPN